MFLNEHIPGYYRVRGSYIKIGLSLRTRRGKLHSALLPGIAYYPIGVQHAYTGNSVSISAPFEMDADRSRIIHSGISAFNAWLLGLASEMTLELLRTDWFDRFGVGVYRAVGEIKQSALSAYSLAIEDGLRNGPTWPSRNAIRKKASRKFAPVRDLNLISRPSLDQFLEAKKCLRPDMNNTPALNQLAAQYGAKQFTVNSLVLLRCAGQVSGTLQSTFKKQEAMHCYTGFSEIWLDVRKQQRCGAALDDCHKNLSKGNRTDLRLSPTTLTGHSTLDAAENLWFVPDEIRHVCPVPERNRLHPVLSKSEVLKRPCKPFDVAKWIDEVIERIEEGKAHERERISLYQYILSVNGRVPKKLLSALRGTPVLRDHKGQWAMPKAITALGTTGVRRFRPGLHLPHRDYSKDRVLAKALRFKTIITGDGVVRFAQAASECPKIAAGFERALERPPRLLTGRTVKRLEAIAFIRTNKGGLDCPANVYIDSPKNRAWIGPQGAYPAGNAKKFFAKLRCRARPDQEDIVQFLETLRENCERPPRTDILYPELVVGLKRDSDPAIYQNRKIVWNGSGYSSPAATILGERWNNVFVGSIPIVKTSRKILAQAYREVGVHDKPEQHHWEQLFLFLAKWYRDKRSPLPRKHVSALRSAYVLCEDLPSLPPDVSCLLNESGHLHTTSDSATGRFVIEDDVPLGTALRKAGIQVAFALNSDPSITSFFRRQGVSFLTEIRVKVKDQVGQPRSAPNWFHEKEYVRSLGRRDFSSVLVALAARDFVGSVEKIQRVRETADRLQRLEHIAFVQDIFVGYRVGKRHVTVSSKYAWTHNTISLTWVRSRSALEGTLASVIAQECHHRVYSDDNRCSDSIFRLITCRNGDDLREYLEQRGIRWHPESENEDLRSGNYVSDVEEAVRAAIRPRDGSSESESIPYSRRLDSPVIKEDPGLSVTVPLSLPPIDRLNVRIVLPGNNSSYARNASRGSRGGSGGWSLVNRKEEWDRIVGRRGEEIVFRFEKNRVREAGHPEDRVLWVSEANPTSDFDILSVEDDGEMLFIEVKGTTGSDGRFHWSMTEFRRALQEQERHVLYRVYQVSDVSPVVCAFRNPVALITSGRLDLDIGSFRAELQPNDHRLD